MTASLEPTTIRQGVRKDGRTLRALLPFLWPAGETELRVRVVAAVVLLIAAKLANVSVPLFYKKAVDVLTPVVGSNPTALAVGVPIAILVAYGTLRVLALAFGELRDAVFAKVAQRAVRQAGLRTFEHLHRLALRFHLERQTGGVSRAVQRGTRGIESLLTYMLFNILPTIVEVGMVCGILWWLYGGWFAVVTFVTVTGYVIWTLTVTEWRTKFRRTMNEKDSEAGSKAVDSLLNFETVKYFGNEAHESRRYDQSLRAYESAAVKSSVSLSLLNIGQAAIISIGLTVVMAMAGYGVVEGRMTIGDFVLVNAYLLQLYMPLNFLGYVYREIKQSLIDMEQMFLLLDEKMEIADVAGAQPLAVTGGNIVFDNVTFGYDSRRQILHGISFSLPPGRTLAIVGPTGSGKSTISRLLFRFYDVDGGRILIDGQDIRDIKQQSLRAAIGIVPQDTVLFNDTVYYNIAYGRPEASREEVEQAARLARIHDFVESLPDGYESRVGERGLKLSGGEKQRVAIARTILKHPRILLFDEATSALDTHTEREIQASLDEVSANRTTLIIAHRLSTVVHADKIIVLDDGRIVERGSHAMLLAKSGRYAAMWNRQQEAERAQKTIEQAGAEGVVRAAE